MKNLKFPNKKTWAELIQRPQVKQEDLKDLVREIFLEIQNTGDLALAKYTALFDKVELSGMAIDAYTLNAASQELPEELQNAIRLAKSNIESFHAAQRQMIEIIETSKGVKCWREPRPIDRVGIYIPGGSAPLFSTVLMLGVPAKLAGCKEIILCTPPDKAGKIHPAILFAANLVGITKIFAIGGIQAIGAMTFGTESIPKVDKIFGPGNQYVTAAKQMSQNYGVAIDMPAGPSELLIIADNTAIPKFLAADLLSQAEHGADSQVILLSNSEVIVKETIDEIEIQLEALPRKAIAEAALNNSKAIVLKSIEDCIEFSNAYAPEHLILATDAYQEQAVKINSAGSVFLGNYSSESAGDYASGTNHTLPTNGYARNYSGVSLESFQKIITFQELSEEGIKNLGPTIELMARAEQLVAHSNAISIRLQYLNQKPDSK